MLLLWELHYPPRILSRLASLLNFAIEWKIYRLFCNRNIPNSVWRCVFSVWRICVKENKNGKKMKGIVCNWLPLLLRYHCIFCTCTVLNQEASYSTSDPMVLPFWISLYLWGRGGAQMTTSPSIFICRDAFTPHIIISTGCTYWKVCSTPLAMGCWMFLYLL